GKSTLINIMAGVHQPSAGVLEVDGRPLVLPHPASSQQVGINVIFQEFSLVPDLSVAENIFLNREPRRGLRIDWNTMQRRTKEVTELLEIDLDPRTEVRNLPVAQQQLVEIARALAFEARVVVMDEPTAALSETEIDRLLHLVRSLADRGVGVVYVSHKLGEVFGVADRITVLRDGQRILTERRDDLTEEQVVSAMVGRELIHTECPPRYPGDVVLSVRDLASGKDVRNVSFELRAGEVLGLAGLMGSGCSEVVETLFGLRPMTSGQVELDGKVLMLKGPRAAIRDGIGYVPADRKTAGILPDLSILHNITIGILDRIRRGTIIDGKQEQSVMDEYGTKLSIRYSSPAQRASNLSGGNQQKVILARALAEECRVFLLAEPTRGVDVGAKVEIYGLIDMLVEAGMAVLVQSSELPELIRLANRCLVFAQGVPRGELVGTEITQPAVMALATGVANGQDFKYLHREPPTSEAMP
ncbi:MAG: sugar ABC transporter ATP-binding protein, partial [Anaerolineae bacterium]|nr:sugar ABC transporter ATP-binding protein [Anaerolineae bacterium]